MIIANFIFSRVKKYFKIFFFLSIMFFFQCQSLRVSFQKEPAFQIKEVYAQSFTGGQPGNSGTNVMIQIIHQENIIPDSLYYQNRVSAIDVKPTESGVLWVGRFLKITRKEINLQENPNDEVSISIPEMKNFPFELKNEEAVLLYHDQEKTYYFKITGIQQKERILFPTVRPQN
jgi:hypothetical protein